MSVLWAIFYGIIQGLTEFLPISSSGHLSILQGIARNGFSHTDYFTFDVLLHLATLFSVCIMYRKELISMVTASFGLAKKILKGNFSFHNFSSDERMILLVCIATLPMVAALFIDEQLEALYANSHFVATMLILNGIMLFLSDRISSGSRELYGASPRHALTVGAFQVLALLPGLSRSGTTITAGRLCGLKRSEAVRFSFILSIPTIIGANIKKIPELVSSPVPAWEIKAYAVGMAAAALCGIAAIKLLSYISRKSSFSFFSVYCLAAGTAALVFL